MLIKLPIDFVKIINPIDKTAGFGVLWFIILYLSAAYLKKYYKPNKKPLKYFLLYLLTAVLNLSFHSAFGHLGEVWGYSMVRDYNNVLVYLGAIFLFMAFLNVEVKNNTIKRIVLFFSPLTFAVYLIHESYFVSPWLWDTINIDTWCIHNVGFIFFAVLTIIGLFICCSFVEFLRKCIFKILKIDFLILKASNYFEEKIRNIIMRSKI